MTCVGASVPDKKILNQSPNQLINNFLHQKECCLNLIQSLLIAIVLHGIRFTLLIFFPLLNAFICIYIQIYTHLPSKEFRATSGTDLKYRWYHTRLLPLTTPVRGTARFSRL